MKEKLTILQNTLAQIETKGNSTLLMAKSIEYLGQIIREIEIKEKVKSKGKNDV